MSKSTIPRTDLLLLGLLLDRSMHSYELHQRIVAEGIDDWFKISMAGVYYALDKLCKHGLVAGSGEWGGQGSTRKAIYRLTDAGRSAFFEAMETHGAGREKIFLDYDLVIYFLNRLPLGKAVSLLEQRQAFLAEQMREAQIALEVEQTCGQSPKRLAVLDHKHRYLEMEQAWLASIIRSVREQDPDAPAGKGRAPMSLSGDLRHQHLPDLMHLIGSGRHSGWLSVTDGVVTCTLAFDNGQLTGASCQRRGESPARPTPEETLEAVSELFRWREGRFTLDQQRPCEVGCAPLRLGTEALILVGCRAVDDWGIIQRLVPSTDSVFELDPLGQRLATPILTPSEEQILAAVDGIKSVAAIAHELDWTIFAASRALYGLAAVGVVHTASPDRIRLRLAFREVAELLCRSTLTWRASEDDTCEQQVNERCQHLPLRLNRGQIEDKTNPQTKVEDLVEIYRQFLLTQMDVIGERFGRHKARQSFDQALHRLAPELQDVAKRYGFDMLRTA